MHARRWLAAAALGVVTQAAAMSPAMAKGGSTDSTSTTGSGGTACVQVNSLAGSADQSVVTSGAWLSASTTVSRCGGNAPSYLVRLRATDTTGATPLDVTSTWYPEKSLPWSTSQQTESAVFGQTYDVNITVTDPATGAVLVSQSKPVRTPDARVASCAIIANLGGTAGYYPGSTTMGAVWVSDSVKNCGGREWLDISFDLFVVGSSTPTASYPMSTVVNGGQAVGYNLIDIEPIPTGTQFELRAEVHDHSTGQVLDGPRSIYLTTLVAR
jgi:hypothetical protein